MKRATTVWGYADADFEAEEELLEAINWESLIVDGMSWLGKPGKESSCIGEFQRLLLIPAKKNLPWLSNELTKSIQSRNVAYKHAKRAGAPQHLSYKQNS